MTELILRTLINSLLLRQIIRLLVIAHATGYYDFNYVILFNGYNLLNTLYEVINHKW